MTAPLKNEIIEVDGQRWLVREARSRTAALNEIGHARATGSVGSKTTVDSTRCGGGVVVAADVHRLNDDGTERQPSPPERTSSGAAVRQWGYTWPITSSDDKPVTSFKIGAAKVLRHMADQERDRRAVVKFPRVRDATESLAREAAWREAADMLDNIIIEGE